MAASPAIERLKVGAATAAVTTPTVSSPAVVNSPFTPLDVTKGPTGIVIEVGSAFVRCGFAGEARPRHFLRTPPSITRRLGSQLGEPQNGMGEGEYEEPWRADLRTVLYDIFYNLLQANPPERPVVICESLLTPQYFRSALADLLLKNLQVPSVLFVPSKGVALIPLQIQTALVVDVGYLEARVLPIYSNALIVNALTTTVLAGQAYNERLRSILNERALIINPITQTSRGCEHLSEMTIEDIKVRLCSIQPQQPDKAGFTADRLLQKMRYDVSAEEYIDIDVHTCVYSGEVLFEEDGDEGEASIASAVLDSLVHSPIDARCNLAQNILVIGGTGRIPGFRRRLLNEINRLVDTNPAYAMFKALSDQFRIINPAFPPHYLSWLGGSFLGCVEHEQTITQSQYVDGKYKFPDWLRVTDPKRVVKERRNPFMVASTAVVSTPSSAPRRRLLSLALSASGMRTRGSSLNSTPYTQPPSNASTATPSYSSASAVPPSPYNPPSSLQRQSSPPSLDLSSVPDDKQSDE